MYQPRNHKEFLENDYQFKQKNIKLQKKNIKLNRQQLDMAKLNANLNYEISQELHVQSQYLHEITAYAKKNDLREEERDRMKQMQISLRDQIFSFNETINHILTYEQTSPVLTAGLLQILSHRFSAANLTPTLFHEITEKEYCAKTRDLLNQNLHRIFHGLAPQEQEYVNHSINSVYVLQESGYYLYNHEKVARIRYSQKIARENKDLASKFTKYQKWSRMYLIGGGVVALWLASTYTGPFGPIVPLLILGAYGFGAYKVRPYLKEAHMSNKIYHTEQNRAQRYIHGMDVPYYLDLEKHYGQEKDTAEKVYAASKQTVDEFFGDSTFLL